MSHLAHIDTHRDDGSSAIGRVNVPASPAPRPARSRSRRPRRSASSPARSPSGCSSARASGRGRPGSRTPRFYLVLFARGALLRRQRTAARLHRARRCGAGGTGATAPAIARRARSRGSGWPEAARCSPLATATASYGDARVPPLGRRLQRRSRTRSRRRSAWRRPGCRRASTSRTGSYGSPRTRSTSRCTPSKGLPLTGVLYGVFALMCIKGWRDWRRSLLRAPRRWERGIVIGKFAAVPHRARASDRRPRCGQASDAHGDRGRARAETRSRATLRTPVDRGRVPRREGGRSRPGRDRPRRRRHCRLGARDDPAARAARPTSSSPRSATADTWAKAMGAEHVTGRPAPAHGADQRDTDPAQPAAAFRVPRPRRPGALRHAGVPRSARRAPARRRSRVPSRRATARYGTRSSATSTRGFDRARADDWTSWTTDEFVEIAQIQNWYEDFLAESASRVLFCDTNAWTTGLFHELYLGRRVPEVDRFAGREYDLYIVCDVDDAVRTGRVRRAARRPASRRDARGVPAASRRDRRAIRRRGRNAHRADGAVDRGRRRAARRAADGGRIGG